MPETLRSPEARLDDLGAILGSCITNPNEEKSVEGMAGSAMCHINNMKIGICVNVFDPKNGIEGLGIVVDRNGNVESAMKNQQELDASEAQVILDDLLVNFRPGKIEMEAS